MQGKQLKFVGAGGPTILDLVSGALSKGEQFVDIITLMEMEQEKAEADGTDSKFLFVQSNDGQLMRVG